MSKPVKNLISASYKKRFGELEGAVLINIRGLSSNDNNKLRQNLAGKKVKVTVVKNTLARKALGDTKLKALTDLIEGPTALVYGGESVVNVARDLLAAIKGMESVKVTGAILDGLVFPANQIEVLSKYPTRREAQAQAITLVVSPGRKLAGQILGPGRKLAAIVKAIEVKKEKEAPTEAPAASA
ncbi:MAG: 50S ribosomal protein L10 [Planctomycetota bacterium]|nr:50S ribosomal protein L10 [Planctomycetota bacterium]